jgi:hypothetical protein
MNTIIFYDESCKPRAIKISQKKRAIYDLWGRVLTRKAAFHFAARKGWTHPKMSKQAGVVAVPKYL